jgi:hypothetical protein
MFDGEAEVFVVETSLHDLHDESIQCQNIALLISYTTNMECRRFLATCVGGFDYVRRSSCVLRSNKLINDLEILIASRTYDVIAIVILEAPTLSTQLFPVQALLHEIRRLNESTYISEIRVPLKDDSSLDNVATSGLQRTQCQTAARLLQAIALHYAPEQLIELDC